MHERQGRSLKSLKSRVPDFEHIFLADGGGIRMVVPVQILHYFESDMNSHFKLFEAIERLMRYDEGETEILRHTFTFSFGPSFDILHQHMENIVFIPS